MKSKDIAKERLLTMKKLDKPICVQENRITMVEAAGRFQRFAQAIRKAGIKRR